MPEHDVFQVEQQLDGLVERSRQRILTAGRPSKGRIKNRQQIAAVVSAMKDLKTLLNGRMDSRRFDGLRRIVAVDGSADDSHPADVAWQKAIDGIEHRHSLQRPLRSRRSHVLIDVEDATRPQRRPNAPQECGQVGEVMKGGVKKHGVDVALLGQEGSRIGNLVTDPIGKASLGRSPLCLADRSGADVNARDRRDDSVLHKAALEISDAATNAQGMVERASIAHHVPKPEKGPERGISGDPLIDPGADQWMTHPYLVPIGVLLELIPVRHPAKRIRPGSFQRAGRREIGDKLREIFGVLECRRRGRPLACRQEVPA